MVIVSYGDNVRYWMESIVSSLRDGHPDITIHNIPVRDLSSVLYEIMSKFNRVPEIDEDGNVIVDFSDTKRLEFRSNMPDDFESARKILTPFLSKMVYNICDGLDVYSIGMTDNVKHIIAYYNWFDFNAEFKTYGYELDELNTRIRLDLSRGKEFIQSHKIYTEYHKIFSNLEVVIEHCDDEYYYVTTEFNDKETFDIFYKFLWDIGVTFHHKHGTSGWLFSTHHQIKFKDITPFDIVIGN